MVSLHSGSQSRVLTEQGCNKQGRPSTGLSLHSGSKPRVLTELVRNKQVEATVLSLHRRNRGLRLAALQLLLTTDARAVTESERASGLGLGWERSFFVGEDCIGLGAIAVAQCSLTFDLPKKPYLRRKINTFVGKKA